MYFYSVAVDLRWPWGPDVAALLVLRKLVSCWRKNWDIVLSIMVVVARIALHEASLTKSSILAIVVFPLGILCRTQLHIARVSESLLTHACLNLRPLPPRLCLSSHPGCVRPWGRAPTQAQPSGKDQERRRWYTPTCNAPLA